MLSLGSSVPAAARVFTDTHWLGIPIAVVGAVLLSLGTIYQSRGVEAGPEHGAGFGKLVRRPVWVLGTVLLAGAVVLQLTALRFSPLIVVQPVGAVALVVTTLVSIRSTGRLPSRRQVLSVALCVAGIAAFVTIAALAAQDVTISDQHLRTILILLAGALILIGIPVAAKRRLNAVFYTAAAGVLYGFVATLAKTVLGRIVQGQFAWLSVAGAAGLVCALVFGASLVQKAHASGSPDLVVAGLTVIDPMVAVLIGIAVLGEADAAPPEAFVGFVLAGAVAIAGVWLVAKASHSEPLSTVPSQSGGSSVVHLGAPEGREERHD